MTFTTIRLSTGALRNAYEDLEDLLMEFGIMEAEDETIVGVAEGA